MEGKLFNSDLSFLPLVFRVKDQSKLAKSLLDGLDRVMFCLKAFDFNDFSLKLMKYLLFFSNHFV